jgi:hypothetical protein
MSQLPTSQPPAPPRAFAQGVGTVFQWTGVTLFLVSFFICCGSALISRDKATESDLTRIGWTFGEMFISAQRALAIALPSAVFFGMALAGVGLGLQAQNRRSAPLGVLVTAAGTAIWAILVVFFATSAQYFLMAVSFFLLLGFGLLLGLALLAARDMRANPPPPDIAILPADYRIPYSHLHQDPPDVRLARELEQRRQRLAVQQKELELLEEKLKRKLQQKDE